MGYIFDPKILHELARKHRDRPVDDMVQALADELTGIYPGHITRKRRWLFSFAGGSTGVMTILHGSLSEYLLIYGTPIGTHGFSGRYLMDVYDFLLAGEHWTFDETNYREPTVIKPGDLSYLPWGRAQSFRLFEGSWVMEYGRGFVPASLPFTLIDTLFRGFEFVTFGKTVWQYSKLVAGELCRGKI